MDSKSSTSRIGEYRISNIFIQVLGLIVGMNPVKNIGTEITFSTTFPTISGICAHVVNNIVIKIICLVSFPAFIDDPGISPFAHKNYIIINIDAFKCIIRTDNNPTVILANVVTTNYTTVLLCCADPKKAMCIIMTVTILKNAIGAAQVRVVKTSIVCFAAV
ncbi:hypothetical protein ES708_13542 [subsurface metagenome]